jgi:hypothetical protein
MKPGRHRKNVGLLVIAAFSTHLACGGNSGDQLVHSTICKQPFTACGGDPTGKWEIVAVCLETDMAAVYNKLRGSACDESCISATVAAAGSVTYVDQTTTYDVKTLELTSDRYSTTCASDMFGFSLLDSTACERIGSQAEVILPGLQETCAYASGNCLCESTLPSSKTKSVSYRVTGTMAVEASGDAYDFCVSGTTMTQRESFYQYTNVVTTLEKR